MEAELDLRCARCGTRAEGQVAQGPDGPFVLVVCQACQYVRSPYHGPGHEELIAQRVLERPSGLEHVLERPRKPGRG